MDFINIFQESIMKIELYRMTSELKALFRKELNPCLATRIRAVYLAMMDKPANEIAKPQRFCSAGV
jgi:hypothetical protein